MNLYFLTKKKSEVTGVSSQYHFLLPAMKWPAWVGSDLKGEVSGYRDHLIHLCALNKGLGTEVIMLAE